MKIELKDYEEFYDKLNNIVNRLENEQVSLEESLKLYEEGVEIHKSLKEILEDEKLRILKFNSNEFIEG